MNKTIGFSIDGTEKMRINASGNVGIGTTNPSYVLDVSGTARIRKIVMPNGIAINRSNTANTNQNANSIAIGDSAGETSQGGSSLAIGAYCGRINQGTYATALGYSAGASSQGQSAIALGNGAGEGTQGSFAIAIGLTAGQTSQGSEAIAIGRSAGATNQQESQEQQKKSPQNPNSAAFHHDDVRSKSPALNDALMNCINGKNNQ